MRTEDFRGYHNFAPDIGGGSNSAKYISGEEIRRVLSPDEVVRVVIPIGNIHGIQRKDEYGNMRMRRIQKAIDERGDQFLKENPPLTCIIPDNDRTIVVSIDGHHRIRGSGSEGYYTVPCEVVNLHTLAEAIKRVDGSEISSADLQKQIEQDIITAQQSFKSMPENKQPQALPRSMTLMDLTKNFQTF